MDIWKVLGIEPTKDKKVIAEAYRNKLVDTNPEDKSEEFKELRNAYEQALLECEKVIKTNKSKVELWYDKLVDLYNNFPERIKVNNWKELLSENVCFSIDSKMQVEEKLITFLMDYYFISHDTWKCIDERFDLLNRTEELYQSYPRDFIDYIVINGIMYDDYLQFDLFEPGESEEECRKYLDLYLKARGSKIEDAMPLFEEIKTLSEYHPYGDALMLSYEIAGGDNSKFADLEKLAEKYNYDHKITYTLANEYFYAKDFAKAQAVLEKALERDENNNRSKWLLALCLAEEGKYAEAKELAGEIYNSLGGDQSQMYDIDQKRKEWNEHLINEYNEKLKENPDDDKVRLDLAWSLIQNDCEKEAAEIAKEIKKENLDEYDYYNLISSIEFLTDEYEKGIEDSDTLINIIKNMKDDGTKETRKKINKLPIIYSKKGFYLCANKRVDEGIVEYEEAVNASKDKAGELTQYARSLYQAKEYEKAEEVIKRLIKVKPDSYHVYFLLAQTAFKLGRDREAFDAVNRAININNHDLECYILKIRILTKNEAKDAVYDVLKYLEDNGAADLLPVKFYRAYTKEIYEDNKAGAYEDYKAIEKRIDDGEYISVGDIFYYRYLCIRGEELDGNKKEDREIMLDLANKGLKYNDEHYGLLDYKAWLLRKDGKNSEALDVYAKIQEIYKADSYIEHQIGLVYYDDVEKKPDECIEHFLKAYELGNNDSLFYLGCSYYYAGNLSEAEKYFMLLRKYEEERKTVDVDSYYRMSNVYKMRKEYDKALEECEIAIEHAKQRKLKLNRYYYQKVRLLRILNRPDEALETVRKLMSETDYQYGYDLLTEINFQFGRYEDAKQVIKERIKKRDNLSEAHKDYVHYYCLTDHYNKAWYKAFDSTSFFTEKDKNQTFDEIYFHDLHFKDCLRCGLKLLEIAEKEKGDILFSTINVAEDYFFLGDREKKLEYANKALELLPESRGKYTVNEALFLIAEARIDICLEKYEEAKQKLEEARSTTCEFCKYCACKDADTFDAYILLAEGKLEETKKLCEELNDKWPEDTTYNSLIRLIEKKK